ncbi:hypothetical protein PENSPDRAFT_690425 [Peniophora sp. CONT]|nr:hypothetical protein PENSPDRAFT_690425 [Peniophora sp. CONT]
MAHHVVESNAFSGGGPGGTVHWERFHEQHAYRSLACWIEMFKRNEKEIWDIIMSRDIMQTD